MASVTDEINAIKREGSVYDNMTLPDFSQVDFRTTPILERLEPLNTSPLESGMNLMRQDTPYVGNLPQYEGFGESRYERDFDVSTEELNQRSLNDLRASRQPWYTQIGNNLINMGTIAATTFLDSSIGTVAGLINVAFSPYDTENETTGIGSQIINNYVRNPGTIKLNSINKWVKERFPTYTTDEYRENMDKGEWWKNFATSQFWGEVIIENAGFTAGMGLSGKVAGSILNRLSRVAEQSNIIRTGLNNAVKEGRLTGNVDELYKKVVNRKQDLQGLGLDQALTTAVKNIRQSGAINSMLSTGIAVSGEARLEGVHSSEQYSEELLTRLESPEGQAELFDKTIMDLRSKDEFDYMFQRNADGMPTANIKPEYMEDLNRYVQENYEKAKVEIDNAAARVAGWDFALNFPVLYASSLWQFGRTFSRGYNTQKGFINNLTATLRGEPTTLATEGAERIVKKGNKYVVNPSIRPYLRAISNPLVEANEEMLQVAAQEASARIAGSKMNSFVGYKLDPDSEQSEIGNLNEIVNAIVKTYSDPSSYMEGFAGLFMGTAGSVNFTMSRSANGRRRIVEGGVWEDIADIQSEQQDLEAITEALNRRVQSPEFKNYYQGLIRHNTLEKEKADALTSNNKFSFENSDHAQLISDIMMFDKAGKLQDLIDNIDSNIDIYSTKDGNRITELAAELKELSVDPNTKVDMYKGLTDEEIVAKTLEYNQRLKNNLDSYRRTSVELNALLGDTFEGNELEEMVYYFSQIGNFETRFSELNTSIRQRLNNINNPGLANKEFLINLQGNEESLSLQEIIDTATPTELVTFLSQNANIQDELAEADKRNVTKILKGMSVAKRKATIDKYTNMLKEFTPMAQSIATDMVDLVQIEKSRVRLLNLFNEYQSRPTTLKETLQQEEVKAAAEQENIIAKPYVDRIKDAQSLSDITTLGREMDELNQRDKFVKLLNESSLPDNVNYNPVAEEYKRINDSLNEVVNTSTLTPYFSAVATPQEEFIGSKVIQVINNKMMELGSAQAGLDPSVYTYQDLQALTHIDNSPISTTERDRIFQLIIDSLTDANNTNAFIQSLRNIAPPTAPVQTQPVPPETTAVTSQTEVFTEDKPTGNISVQEVKTENQNIKETINTSNVIPRGQWANGVFEIDLDYYNSTGLIRDQRNPTYARSVEYLASNGAFNYINNGGVRRGDRIHLMASQAYWDYLKEGADQNQIDWVDNNKPLLLVKQVNDTSQIVGTFTTSLNPNLHAKVVASDSTGVGVVSEEFLTVANVYPGRLGFTQTEQSVRVLTQGILPSGVQADTALGVMMDTGEIVTNLPISTIAPNTPIDQTRGRVYLMVRGANNAYLPSAVRVKNFSEINLTQQNPYIGNINTAITGVANAAQSLDDTLFSNAVKALRDYVFIGGTSSIGIHLRNASTGNMVDTNITLTQAGGVVTTIQVANTAPDGTTTINPNIRQELVQLLVALKVPLQVSQARVNVGSYTQDLIDADVLTTNLQLPYVRGAAFTMNPLDDNLNPVTAPVNTPKVTNPTTRTVVETTQVVTGKPVNIGSTAYTLTPENKVFQGNSPVTDNSVVTSVLAENYLDGLSQTRLQEMTVNLPESEGAIAGDYIRFPDGRVWDGVSVLAADSFIGIRVNQAQEVSQQTPPITQRQSLRPNRRPVNSQIRNAAMNTQESTSEPQTNQREIEESIAKNKEYQNKNCNGVVTQSELNDPNNEIVYTF